MNSQRKLWWFRFSFVLPALLIFLIVSYIPFLSTLYLSLTNWDGISAPEFIGLRNFSELTQDRRLIQSGVNTLWILLYVTLFMSSIALLLALALNKKFRSQSFLRTAFYLPQILSLVVVSAVWSGILQYYGNFNALLEKLGLGYLIRDWLGTIESALPAVIAISTWQGIGFATIIFLAGLQSVPREVYEAAEMDGARGWRLLTKIIMPLLMPSITIVVFLSIVASLKFFDMPYVMTNGGPGDATATLALVIYDYAFMYRKMGYATAAGLVLMILICTFTFIQLYFMRKREVEL